MQFIVGNNECNKEGRKYNKKQRESQNKNKKTIKNKKQIEKYYKHSNNN